MNIPTDECTAHNPKPGDGVAFDEWDLYIAGVSSTGGDGSYFGTFLDGSATQGGTGVGGVLAVAPFEGRVYIGGSFFEWQGEQVSKIAAVGGLPGGKAEQLGLGLNGVVRALAVHDGLLVVAGDFTKAFHESGAVDTQGIAAWNGERWSRISGGKGARGTVSALAVNGTLLYVGGDFAGIGGMDARGLASWDGASWRSIGGGVSGGGVEAVAVSGDDVIISGSFSYVGRENLPSAGLARWNGKRWTDLGQGFDGSILAMKVLGSSLVVGGEFRVAGGVEAHHIAILTSGEWAPLPSGGVEGGGIHAMLARDGCIYAGGSFTSLSNGGDAKYFVKWCVESSNVITPVALLGEGMGPVRAIVAA